MKLLIVIILALIIGFFFIFFKSPSSTSGSGNSVSGTQTKERITQERPSSTGKSSSTQESGNPRKKTGRAPKSDTEAVIDYGTGYTPLRIKQKSRTKVGEISNKSTQAIEDEANK